MTGRPLTITCVHCARHVVLTYGGAGLYRSQLWVCPHCAVLNGLNLSGLILNIRKLLQES